jgi:hypothetical protein
MRDVCFVSQAFGKSAQGDDRYLEQQKRLKESILAIYPDANLLFFTNSLPEGAKPFHESLYGLKVHAIEQAWKNGFTKVIWFDPAMVLMDKIDDLLKFRMVAIKDDNKLNGLISEKAREYFNIEKEEMVEKDWRLVGGSMYYFDFGFELTQKIFQTWKKAELNGIFGSQWEACTERINGHRNDESCAAASIYLNGHEPTDAYKVRYCVEKNPMTQKFHFK